MAVRLVQGGFQSYDPSKAKQSYIKKTFKPKKSSGGGAKSIYGSGSSGSSSKSKFEQTLDKAKQESAEKVEVIAPKPTPTSNRISPTNTPTSKPGYTLNPERSQEKWTSYLTSDTTAEVQPYRGITMPYGEKERVYYEPAFGTVTEETKSGFKKVEVFKDLQAQEVINPEISMPSDVIVLRAEEKIIRDIKSDLLPKYQEKINNKELTLEEAQEEFQKEATKKFDKKWEEVSNSQELKDKLSASRKFRERYKTNFDTEFKKEQRNRRALLLTDAAVGLLTVAAPAVGTAYFTGRGIKSASEGVAADTYKAEIGPSGEITMPRYKDVAVQSEKSKEAGMLLGFAGVTSLGTPGKIGASITAEREAAIISKPTTTNLKNIFKQGDTTFVKLSSSKTTGVASSEAEAIMPIKMGKGGSFEILSPAQGTVKTTVTDFMKQGVTSVDDSLIKSTTDFNLAGRGIVKEGKLKIGNILLPEEKMFITSGEGVIVPESFQGTKITQEPSKFWSAFTKDSGQVIMKKPVFETKYIGDQTKQFFFGGTAVKDSEKTIWTAGKAVKARLYPKRLAIKSQLGITEAGGLAKGPTSYKGLTWKFRPQAFGETLSTAKTTKTGYTSFKGGGAKASRDGGKWIRFIDATPEERIAMYGKSSFKSSTDDFVKGTKEIVNKKTGTSQLLEQNAASELKIKPSVKLSEKTIAKQFGGTAFAEIEKIGFKSATRPASFLRFTPATTSVTKVISKIKPNVKSITKGKLNAKEDSIIKQSSLLDSSVESATDSLQDSVVKYTSKLSQKPFQVQETVTPQSIFFNGNYKGNVGPAAGGGKGGIVGWPSIKASPSSIGKKQQGYIPQAKTKGGRWVSLSSKPLTREAALSRGSRAVDNTTSAQFRIKKSKGKVKTDADNYFGVTQNKYRPYKIKKGSAVKLPDQYIEKRGSRIDTPGEKKGLKLAKFVKQKGWGKSKKKTKSPWLV